MRIGLRRIVASLVIASGCLVIGSTGCVESEVTKVPLCPQYCDAVVANCTGDARVYEDRKQCNQICDVMIAQNREGVEGEQNEDTVGCRLAHARAAKNNPDECKKASAYGGGACGPTKRVFCTLVDAICITGFDGGITPYPSQSTCEEKVQAIPYDDRGKEGPQDFLGPNNINCRMFHLLLALGDRTGHCQHTAVVSDVCNK